ncbi:MAG TPA: helix-turn-helix transcriptional regulator [Kiritimatiellia bacterium]|nr:helix-turn-helix transcriptional regulator [Kiritimatiellia bacterium]HMP35196.1 helix-turn-helix transcriptional regulator [Kiritimatiellia bacterium]
MIKRHASLTSFGGNLRKAREAKKLTQEALAEIAGLDSTYISGIERGLRNPSLLSMLRIAQALETTVSELGRGIDK